MVTPALLPLGAGAAFVLALGTALLFRTDRALAVQERYAERFSATPPSEHPDYYDDTEEWRRFVLRFGGVVVGFVGLLGVAAVVYGALVA